MWVCGPTRGVQTTTREHALKDPRRDWNPGACDGKVPRNRCDRTGGTNGDDAFTAARPEASSVVTSSHDSPALCADAHCTGCDYPLRGLQGRVCPECGRGYDPGDARSFRSGPRPLAILVVTPLASYSVTPISNWCGHRLKTWYVFKRPRKGDRHFLP